MPPLKKPKPKKPKPKKPKKPSIPAKVKKPPRQGKPDPEEAWKETTSWTARRPLMGSNGVPYVFSNFEYDGQVPVDAFVATDDCLTENFGQQRLPQPQPRINELPLSLAIVNFPD